MIKLYVSELQEILLGLKTLAIANKGGTEDLKELIKKVEKMLLEEEKYQNTDI